MLCNVLFVCVCVCFGSTFHLATFDLQIIILNFILMCAECFEALWWAGGRYYNLNFCSYYKHFIFIPCNNKICNWSIVQLMIVFNSRFLINKILLLGVMWGVNCDLTSKGLNFIMRTTFLLSMKFELQLHLFLLLLCVDNESSFVIKRFKVHSAHHCLVLVEERFLYIYCIFLFSFSFLFFFFLANITKHGACDISPKLQFLLIISSKWINWWKIL